ncbi:MAG TPA: hypothetical protein VGL94_15940 [Ktedonobacteraceae bacterium]
MKDKKRIAIPNWSRKGEAQAQMGYNSLNTNTAYIAVDQFSVWW